MDDASSQFATKQDLRDLKHEIVDELTNVIGEIIGEVSTTVGSGFQSLERRVDMLERDVQDLKAGQTRIENILRPTLEQIGDHAIRISRLGNKTGLL